MGLLIPGVIVNCVLGEVLNVIGNATEPTRLLVNTLLPESLNILGLASSFPLQPVESQPPLPTFQSSIELARQEMTRMTGILEERANSIVFQNVSMDSTIIDHPEILEYVNKSLLECDQLLVE